MLSTGIPELRTIDDIRYISNALCLSKNDEQAREDFRKKLAEAVKHSWSVSINWYFHNVARTGNWLLVLIQIITIFNFWKFILVSFLIFCIGIISKCSCLFL